MSPPVNNPNHINGENLALNARQRKQVYMHSSIFDDGPTNNKKGANSTYHQENQTKIHKSIQEKEKLEFNPVLRVPNASDLKQTQNYGHSAVFPKEKIEEKEYLSKEIYNPTKKPGNQVDSRNLEPHLVDSRHKGDVMQVVRHAKENREGIPREMWACPDVFLSKKKEDGRFGWKDERNQITRSVNRGDTNITANEAKHYELSSSLFDHDRLKSNPSTGPPIQKRILLPSSAHFLAEDSSRATNALAPETSNAQTRFHSNLEVSQESSIPVSRHPMSPRQHAVENPRRRNEKNFSDLFESQMAPPKKVGQRSEASATQNCSWLDSRSEICFRNKNPTAVLTGEGKPNQKRAKELKSTYFEEKPDTPLEKQCPYVRSCYDTTGLMTQKSEIARSQRTGNKSTEDSQKSAFQRKQNNLSSPSITTTMGSPQKYRSNNGVHGIKFQKHYQNIQNQNLTSVVPTCAVTGVQERPDMTIKISSPSQLQQLALRGSGNILK